MTKTIAIQDIIARFPKTRPLLPEAFQKIYREHYQHNRQGSTHASWVATHLEQWMHHKVATDLPTMKDVYETLEIGAGTLNHLPWENLNHPYDIVEPFTELYINSVQLPLLRTIFRDMSEIAITTHRYDRILAIATFEHLCDLPQIIAKSGLLLKNGGVLRVAIPAEGSWLWKLAWKFSTGIEFRLKYHLDYEILMHYEHINNWLEISQLLHYFFAQVSSNYLGIMPSFSLYQFYECKEPILARCGGELKVTTA